MERYHILGSSGANVALAVPKTASEFASASRASNTKRSYGSDLKSFTTWCIEHGQRSLPADPLVVADYLAHLASIGRKVSTIRRAKAAINTAHRLSGFMPPGRDLRVQEVVQGIARTLGTAPTRKKPLVTKDLVRLLQQLPAGLKGTRDRALLLLGFSAALRRSELVALRVEDLEFVDEGVVVRLRRSKTDQTGSGTAIGVPFGTSRSTCPVRALETWIRDAGLERGPVFRSVSRHGHLGVRALSTNAVAELIKEYVEAAGLNPELYAGHSLRAGFASSAAMAGAEERDIARQTRHRSTEVLRSYIRTATVFERNAATRLGL